MTFLRCHKLRLILHGLVQKTVGLRLPVHPSPIGDQTGSTLTSTTEVNALRQPFDCQSGVTYTVSIHVKQDTANTFTWKFSGSLAGINEAVTVDFTDGTVSNGSIQALSNGWYRVSVTATATGNATPSVMRGKGSGTTHIWGLQVEEGSTATDYISTTSTISGAPRLDHDSATGESLGLLIEEARTNLVSYSEEFDNASWFKSGSFSTSQVANAAAAPDGSLTAEQYTNASSGTNNVRKALAISSGNYTFSIYLKAATVQDVGKYVTVGGHVSNAVHNRVLVQLPAEWTRFTASGTFNLSTTWAFGVDGRTDNFGGMNQPREESTFYVWGAQLEQGSFPTSYIPTDGSAVTRAADVAEITGTNFSSFYNQSEGTMFFDGTSQPSGSVDSRLFSFNDGSFNNRQELFKLTNGKNQVFVKDNNVTQVNIVAPSADKVALGYASNNYAITGSQPVQTDNSAVVPAATQVNLGCSPSNTGFLNGHIKRLIYFPTRLPDATLKSITS